MNYFRNTVFKWYTWCVCMCVCVCVCVCVRARVCVIYGVYNYVDLLTHFDYCYCLMQKLESRKAVFLKSSSLTSEQRNLWKKVLIKEFMSSEESAEEDFDGKKRPALAVKPLLWRAPKVDRFLNAKTREVRRVKQSIVSSRPCHVL